MGVPAGPSPPTTDIDGYACRRKVLDAMLVPVHVYVLGIEASELTPMGGPPHRWVVRHIDGNKMNNRKANLEMISAHTKRLPKDRLRVWMVREGTRQRMAMMTTDQRRVYSKIDTVGEGADATWFALARLLQLHGRDKRDSCNNVWVLQSST